MENSGEVKVQVRVELSGADTELNRRSSIGRVKTDVVLRLNRLESF